MKNIKIGTKMLLVILLVSLLSLLVIATLSYTEMLNLAKYSTDANMRLGVSASEQSKTALKNQAEEYITKIANEQANKSDALLTKIQSEIMSSSSYLTSLYVNKNNFDGRMLPLPNETENNVASSKYMLPPNMALTESLQNELYLISNAEYMLAPILKQNNALNNIYLGTRTGLSYRYSYSNAYNSDYDPRTRSWYTAAMQNVGKPTWVDTYIDSYGSVCVTFCTTFVNEFEEVQGVVATDITLKTIQDDILSMKIGETGYAFVTDQTGKILAHPQYNEEGFEANPIESGSADKEAISAMLASENGLAEVSLNGKPCYLAYATLPTTGWKLGIAVEVEEIIAPALETEQQIADYTKETHGFINKTLRDILMNFVIILSISAMVILVFSYILSKTITDPIKRLVQSVHTIGNGDFDIKIEVKGKDEIAELALAFNEMTDDLQEYIRNLSSATAEKERIGAELDVAKNIQASMLPCIFPAFPERLELDIFATMTPAKEVGGDFYDFFLVNEDNLMMVMADVSGKGVPAALFMVIAKTLIKNIAQTGLSPKEVLEKVNNQLCENNDAELFVTVWLGKLQICTGILTAANAGHEYPVIKRSGGDYELIKDKHGFVLAGMEDSRYQEYELVIEAGDMLYLYTDGVPEATNVENELYGTERMLKILNSSKDAYPTELLPRVKADIDTFVGDAPQFDDITMLGILYKGENGAEQ